MFQIYAKQDILLHYVVSVYKQQMSEMSSL